MMSTASAPTTPAATGQPRGLSTLFFTEMWERFSYYGMRGLLVLYMTKAVRDGGMGLDDKLAGSIYGLYTAAVYLASLPGGWLADRWLGAQQAVWYGGLIIAAGHFTMVFDRPETFFLGLVLVVIGTGLLKPNISAIVGGLYPEGGTRRDAGFTVFYMGINLGAFLGPFVCGTLGEKFNWHYGFGAAGVGMVLGLAQYRFSRAHLGDAGRLPGHPTPLGGQGRGLLALVAIAFAAFIGLAMAGVIHIAPIAVAQWTTAFLLAVAVGYFALLFTTGKLTPLERNRVIVILILFAAAALFWSGFEQAGSSLNLFAERFTVRSVPGFTTAIPASWFQSVGPVFVITLAPVMAGLWVGLARRHLEPSIPAKFAFGLLLLAVGFLVMVGAAVLVARGQMVGPQWLTFTYLIHTFGELCLSPVGLSSVTKLAPKRLVGQLMGIWFLAASMGNLLAGLVAGEFNVNALSSWPGLYLKIVLLPAVAGLLLLAAAKPIKKLMAGVN